MTTCSGPCSLCGDVDYPLSFGGPKLCPACDAGNFHDPSIAMKRMLGLKPPPAYNERRPTPADFVAVDPVR